MKKLIMGALLAAAAILAPVSASAIDLNNILGKLGGSSNGGSTLTDAITGVVDGLLSNDNVTVEQMAGTWTATGSAVAFQSDNLLKKAGGGAAASTIESKLNGYYQKLGLIGSTLTITSDGKFTLKAGKISLNGTVTKRDDGNFDFTFTPFGSVKLGSIKAYVEKPLTGGLKVMFDASKLMSLVSTLSGVLNNSTLNSISSLLNSYDGLCLGFAFKG